MADKGYDSDGIVHYIEENDMEAVIPPRKNRKVQREYDKYLYRFMHLVENAFMELKKWRGIATRYAKKHFIFSSRCSYQMHGYLGKSELWVILIDDTL